MNSFFHRRVQVIVSDGHSNPRVSGYEEVYENGRHQVRTWGDRDRDRLIDRSTDRGLSLEPTANGSVLRDVIAVAQRGYQKAKRVIQNVPTALQAAWAELNR